MINRSKPLKIGIEEINLALLCFSFQRYTKQFEDVYAFLLENKSGYFAMQSFGRAHGEELTLTDFGKEYLKNLCAFIPDKELAYFNYVNKGNTAWVMPRISNIDQVPPQMSKMKVKRRVQKKYLGDL